jgi:hypothetical protein
MVFYYHTPLVNIFFEQIEHFSKYCSGSPAARAYLREPLQAAGQLLSTKSSTNKKGLDGTERLSSHAHRHPH